jgi:hypothetical protein
VQREILQSKETFYGKQSNENTTASDSIRRSFLIFDANNNGFPNFTNRTFTSCESPEIYWQKFGVSHTLFQYIIRFCYYLWSIQDLLKYHSRYSIVSFLLNLFNLVWIICILNSLKEQLEIKIVSLKTYIYHQHRK